MGGLRRAEQFVLPAGAIAVLLSCWAIAVELSGTKIFPTPLEVAAGLGELLSKGLLWSYLYDSLLRVALGYSAAVILGVPAGMLLGWFPLAGKAFNPLIQMLRPISPLAWMPLAIIWFGVGNAAPVFLILLAAFFPIVVATMNGVRNVPRMYRQAGANFGLTPSQMLLRVIFPAILPRILTGLRIALGVAWLVLVAAEMIAVNSGLGYMIIDARNAGKRYDLVIGGMLLIGVIGLILDIVMRRAERFSSVRWGFNQ